jgi:hypothetical protein
MNRGRIDEMPSATSSCATASPLLREEPRLLARRLEGWLRVIALRSTFETHRFAMLLDNGEAVAQE